MAKFNRMTLPAPDGRAMRDFYVDRLGFTLEWENPEAGLTGIADASGFRIFLHQAPGAAPEGLAFAIEVDDVERLCADLTARGVALTHGPRKTFWGYGAELRDPAGYIVRLWDERTMRERG